MEVGGVHDSPCPRMVVRMRSSSSPSTLPPRSWASWVERPVPRFIWVLGGDDVWVVLGAGVCTCWVGCIDLVVGGVSSSSSSISKSGSSSVVEG